nr:reverse transcriptase domain-containing protein [Tanacetum cinerariifolium]
MSSDYAQSAVTYTSISSDSNGPSWGIPLMNAEYHAPSDDDIQVEDDDDDPEEDPEEHESKGSDETEPFKEDKIAVTPPPSRHRGARISVRPQTPMAASTQALIDAFASGSSLFPLPPTSPAYDHEQLGRRAAMIHRKDDILVENMLPQRIFTLTGPPPGCDVAESLAAAAARAPRSQYDFVDTVEAGQGLIRSPGHDTRTIARAADRAEDASYVRALQASKRRMMTSIEEVKLRVSCQAQVRKELLARLETLETHMSRMEWQRQSAENLAVTQMMRIHTLEARARADKVEDADSSCVVGLSQWLEKMESVFHISGCAVDNQVKFATCTLLGAALTWWNGHVRNLGHDAAYAMTWGTLKKKLIDKYCPKGKRKANDSPRNNQQQPHKKKNVARAYTAGPGVNTRIRGCTLNFMNHPFNIDLMPVPLGSFDVIIGMDWLTKYHGVIICDEKIVRVPFRREMLIFQGNGDNQREESRLNIISCTKAQEYLSKGCDVFLANVITKEAKDKSEGKRLEDVPIVRDFPEVFPEDLPGIPPARPVEFQIDLVPGAVPVARAPYRLAPPEMKELQNNFKNYPTKDL